MLTIEKINNVFEYRTGNIFDQTDLNYIAHQCNCFHCFGAGVANQIARIYPEAKAIDKTTEYGDNNKMGNFVIAHVTDESKPNLKGIINMYCQFHPGCYKTDAEYEERLGAIYRCLVNMKNTFNNEKVTIGFPWLIGCGISGLNEEDVFDTFKMALAHNKNIKVVFVDFNNSFSKETKEEYYQPEFDWNEERNDAHIEANSAF